MNTRRYRKLFCALPALALLAGFAAPSLADEPPAPTADPDPAGMLGFTSGEQIYTQICQGCHMPGGKGANGAGQYPALADNPNLASAPYAVVTILGGRRNMPAFDQDKAPAPYFPPTWLSDEQVANVVNYLRNEFGNRYPDQITAAEVRALRPEKGN